MTTRQLAIIGASVYYRKGMGFKEACYEAAESYNLPEMSIKAWKRFKSDVIKNLKITNDWKGERHER